MEIRGGAVRKDAGGEAARVEVEGGHVPAAVRLSHDLRQRRGAVHEEARGLPAARHGEAVPEAVVGRGGRLPGDTGAREPVLVVERQRIVRCGLRTEAGGGEVAVGVVGDRVAVERGELVGVVVGVGGRARSERGRKRLCAIRGVHCAGLAQRVGVVRERRVGALAVGDAGEPRGVVVAELRRGAVRQGNGVQPAGRVVGVVDLAALPVGDLLEAVGEVEVVGGGSAAWVGDAAAVAALIVAESEREAEGVGERFGPVQLVVGPSGGADRVHHGGAVAREIVAERHRRAGGVVDLLQPVQLVELTPDGLALAIGDLVEVAREVVAPVRGRSGNGGLRFQGAAVQCVVLVSDDLSARVLHERAVVLVVVAELHRQRTGRGVRVGHCGEVAREVVGAHGGPVERVNGLPHLPGEVELGADTVAVRVGGLRLPVQHVILEGAALARGSHGLGDHVAVAVMREVRFFTERILKLIDATTCVIAVNREHAARVGDPGLAVERVEQGDGVQILAAHDHAHLELAVLLVVKTGDRVAVRVRGGLAVAVVVVGAERVHRLAAEEAPHTEHMVGGIQEVFRGIVPCINGLGDASREIEVALGLAPERVGHLPRVAQRVVVDVRVEAARVQLVRHLPIRVYGEGAAVAVRRGGDEGEGHRADVSLGVVFPLGDRAARVGALHGVVESVVADDRVLQNLHAVLERRNLPRDVAASVILVGGHAAALVLYCRAVAAGVVAELLHEAAGVGALDEPQLLVVLVEFRLSRGISFAEGVVEPGDVVVEVVNETREVVQRIPLLHHGTGVVVGAVFVLHEAVPFGGAAFDDLVQGVVIEQSRLPARVTDDAQVMVGVILILDAPLHDSRRRGARVFAKIVLQGDEPPVAVVLEVDHAPHRVGHEVHPVREVVGDGDGVVVPVFDGRQLAGGIEQVAHLRLGRERECLVAVFDERVVNAEGSFVLTVLQIEGVSSPIIPMHEALVRGVQWRDADFITVPPGVAKRTGRDRWIACCRRNV